MGLTKVLTTDCSTDGSCEHSQTSLIKPVLAILHWTIRLAPVNLEVYWQPSRTLIRTDQGLGPLRHHNSGRPNFTPQQLALPSLRAYVLSALQSGKCASSSPSMD